MLNQEYATETTRDWKVKESGVAHVTRFEVDHTYLVSLTTTSIR